MGEFIDRTFRNEYYGIVNRDYELASKDYRKGLYEFNRRQAKSYREVSYEYKILVHNHIDEIRELDALISNGEDIETRFPLGTEAFRKKRGMPSGASDVSYMERLISSKSEIMELDFICREFLTIKRKFPAEVEMVAGTNPDLERKRYVLANRGLLEQLNRSNRKYAEYKDRYPLSIAALMGGSVTQEKLVYLDTMTNEKSLDVLEKFLQIRKSCTPDDFKSLFGTLSCPGPADMSPDATSFRERLIRLYDMRESERRTDRQFDELASSYAKPLVLMFGKPVRNFTRREKETAIADRQSLERVKETYFKGSLAEFYTPQFGNYLNFLIGKAEAGKACRLPESKDDLISVIKYYRYVNFMSQEQTAMFCADQPSPDDVSAEAISVRKAFLERMFSFSGVQYDEYGFSFTLSRDELISELLNFPGYGSAVRFADAVSIKSAYKIETDIEAQGTTFSRSFEFVSSHRAAIKSYNKGRNGQSTVYVEDYVLAARKDKALLSYIDSWQECEALRGKVGTMMNSYAKGFKEYVGSYCPKFDIGEADAVVLKKFVDDERRIRELDTIAKAKEIIPAYPDAVSQMYPRLSASALTYEEARQVCANEQSLRVLQKECSWRKALRQRVERATRGWPTTKGGIPHYFFYWYYPKNHFSVVTSDSQNARDLIYDFKDGREHMTVARMVCALLRSSFESKDLSSFTFVCIPASNNDDNERRYKEFSEYVCSELGMRNAFTHIHITKEKTPKHLGGSDKAEYSYDEYFFSEAQIVLFDDVVTTGGSIERFKSTLEGMKASVICAVSIGKTFSGWHGRTPEPHPYTGRL